MRNRQDKKLILGDLGCYDGPPIGLCQESERLLKNAVYASARLRDAILKAGLAA